MSSRSNYTPQRFIVSLNVADVCSLGALAFSLAATTSALSRQYDLSVALFIFAMILDFLDGPIARSRGISRDFGRYLDGFVDVVLYLLGPSIFLYVAGFTRVWEQLALLAFIASGMIRLSVFNEIGNVKNGKGNSAYLGMPVFWSIFWLAGAQFAGWFWPFVNVFPIILVSIIVQSILMLVRVKFFKFRINAFTILAFLMLAAPFAVRGLI